MHKKLSQSKYQRSAGIRNDGNQISTSHTQPQDTLYAYKPSTPRSPHQAASPLLASSAGRCHHHHPIHLPAVGAPSSAKDARPPAPAVAASCCGSTPWRSSSLYRSWFVLGLWIVSRGRHSIPANHVGLGSPSLLGRKRQSSYINASLVEHLRLYKGFTMDSNLITVAVSQGEHAAEVNNVLLAIDRLFTLSDRILDREWLFKGELAQS